MFGPIFVCRCCERKLFEHQVIKVNISNFRENIDKDRPGLFSQCIQSYSESDGTEHQTGKVVTSYDIDKRNYLCKSCKGSMQRGKMPKMCSNNGLKVDRLPKRLKLTEL